MTTNNGIGIDMQHPAAATRLDEETISLNNKSVEHHHHEEEEEDELIISQAQEVTDQKHSLRGIIYMLLGSFSFSVMFLLVKCMEDANTFVLVFYRSVVQSGIALTVLVVGWWKRNHNDTNNTSTTRISLKHVLLGPPGCDTRFYLWVRGTFGASAICAWYYGIQHLPLSDAVTLQFTTPPFAAAFAVCLVGEPWLFMDWIGALVCLLGVALIAHPTWLFDNDDDDHGEYNNNQNEDDEHAWINGTITTNNNLSLASDSEEEQQQSLAVMVTLAGAAMAGLAYVSVRKIGHKAPAMVMVWYDGVLCLPIVLAGSAILEGSATVWRFDRDLSIIDGLLILLMGISAFGGQWFTNLGLQEESAATATLVTTTQIVWTHIFNLAFLNEPINGWSFAGTGLILGYVLLVGAMKVNSNSRRSTQKESFAKCSTQDDDDDDDDTGGAEGGLELT